MMVEIDDKVISTDIFDHFFVCDLKVCKGQCCVEGDAGAPLTLDEAQILPQIYPAVSLFLDAEGNNAIAEQGTSTYDNDDMEYVTPLIEGGRCAYSIFENGVALCGIEKAWKAGKVSFRKPVSCHLYPIRTQQYEKFEALNYDRWPICAPACSCGSTLKVPVYRFVKEALIRKYGELFFEQLEAAAALWQKNKDTEVDDKPHNVTNSNS